MSVVFENDSGWVVDALSLIDKGHSRFKGRGEGRNVCFQYCFKPQCFHIFKSHLSSTRAGSAVDEEIKDNMTYKPPKKRKRKHTNLNQGEIDSLAYHEKIRSVILEGTKSLVEAVRFRGHLNGAVEGMEETLPAQDCNLAALCDIAKELPISVDQDNQEDPVQYLDTEDGCNSHLDLFSRITENNTDWAIEVTLMGEKYVIPPETAFLLCDITKIQPLVHYGKRFEMIVLDPPWENKSVKRSGRYNFLPSSQLKRLPIPLLASPECLVVTWVTNRPSHRRFIRDELYPHWGVEVVAEWFWVKVTKSGEFVFPLDSPHKKPYEVLVLGRYRGSSAHALSSSGKAATPVKDQRVIVSVPSALHSHKPSLSEVLKPYVAADARGLELFARSLQPGWTSWGNEVIKFQHTSYFSRTTVGEAAGVNEDTSTGRREGTDTPMGTHMDTPTGTPTGTNMDTPTGTNTDTPTGTNTDTPTGTNTDTPTGTNTDTPTGTNMDTPTGTNMDTPTGTNTDTPTGTNTDTPTGTNTDTPTSSNMDTPTGTNMDTPTGTNTDTPTGTNTDTPTGINTDTPTGTNTDTPTSTNMDPPTGTHTDPPTGIHTDPPTGSHMDTPTGRHMDTPTGSHMDTPTGSHMDTPTGRNMDTPTGSHMDTPTGTDTETLTGTHMDTPAEPPVKVSPRKPCSLHPAADK